MVRTLAVFVVLALAGGDLAHAGVIFSLGNNPHQSGEENVLFSSDQTGSLVTGFTASTNMMVDFSSNSDTLVVTASGQAQLAALDGTVNNVTISLPGGATYESLILNPFLGGSVGSGPATVTVTASDGTYTYTYPEGLEKGQNFLTITASSGKASSARPSRPRRDSKICSSPAYPASRRERPWLNRPRPLCSPGAYWPCGSSGPGRGPAKRPSARVDRRSIEPGNRLIGYARPRRQPAGEPARRSRREAWRAPFQEGISLVTAGAWKSAKCVAYRCIVLHERRETPGRPTGTAPPDRQRE